jgi:plastocyanin
MRPWISTWVLAAGLAVGGGAASASPAATLELRDHRFTPDVLTVPAGQKVQIVLVNQDAATEEFDSRDLGVEELVTPKGRATFTIGPLKPGTYAFMGEFHADTAQGRVVAVDEAARRPAER